MDDHPRAAAFLAAAQGSDPDQREDRGPDGQTIRDLRFRPRACRCSAQWPQDVGCGSGSDSCGSEGAVGQGEREEGCWNEEAENVRGWTGQDCGGCQTTLESSQSGWQNEVVGNAACRGTAKPIVGLVLQQETGVKLGILGIALNYALVQWRTMDVYLRDGRVDIDNNLVENAIRPTALGKKNWLFMGDADAGGRGAILYTVIESCRRRQIDPYAYLRDVLIRLPDMTNRQIPAVTPQAWSKATLQVQPQAAL
jgi:hypothetical protein